MPSWKKVVAQFEIPYLSYLNAEGKPEQPLPDFALQPAVLIALYKMMKLTRAFDKKAIVLQRTGQLGTYPSVLGQEALSVGIGAAMAEEDVLCPYYRDYGAQFWRGVKMEEILLYWGGDERGSNFQKARSDFPLCVPIGTQTLHAAGVAAALKYQQSSRAVVTTIGDGGTSRGDFYEAMNIAGVWELPLVFVINNNQWAISVPRSAQTKAQTLAQKAIAAGLAGWQVDGNDVIAVKAAVEEALTHARSGKGAVVIEALTYRLSDHTTADDASRYRPAEELTLQQKNDPLSRIYRYLLDQQVWDSQQEQILEEKITHDVQNAVTQFLNSPLPLPESMFDYLYETLPTSLASQRNDVKKRGPQ